MRMALLETPKKPLHKLMTLFKKKIRGPPPPRLLGGTTGCVS